MKYVIEEMIDGNPVALDLISQLDVVKRPDGGQSNNVRVDEPLFDETGRELFVRLLFEPEEAVNGGGPVLVEEGPLNHDGEKWTRSRKMGPDPTPGDGNYDYVSLRRRDYPTIEDQLDAQFHDAKDGTTIWVDSIQAVKDKYPKPVVAEEPVVEEPAAEEAVVEEAVAEEAPAEEPVVEETP